LEAFILTERLWNIPEAVERDKTYVSRKRHRQYSTVSCSVLENSYFCFLNLVQQFLVNCGFNVPKVFHLYKVLPTAVFGFIYPLYFMANVISYVLLFSAEAGN
jgi:hypothetical protein